LWSKTNTFVVIPAFGTPKAERSALDESVKKVYRETKSNSKSKGELPWKA